MQAHQPRPRSLSLTALFTLTAALALVPACGDAGDDGGTDSDTDATDSGVDSGTSEGPELMELYQLAVDDAEVADADEVVDDLVAITPDNPELSFDDDGRVLMVTWTSWDGYDGLDGLETSLGIEVWMTPAPYLQEFCQPSELTGDALALRLEQLLGLPPMDGKDRVVQLWVPPEGLFRPAPDAEIDDAVAELDFPQAATQEHIDWINELTMMSYGEGGYPWTRLGYTYDWSPDSPEVGLSEFVARAGTVVVVDSVSSNDEYCQ